jgi:hypothetical protein
LSTTSWLLRHSNAYKSHKTQEDKRGEEHAKGENQIINNEEQQVKRRSDRLFLEGERKIDCALLPHSAPVGCGINVTVWYIYQQRIGPDDGDQKDF